jgi:hypothetical protein
MDTWIDEMSKFEDKDSLECFFFRQKLVKQDKSEGNEDSQF